jgi:cell wall-associated NlpC family hydrolase
VTRGYLPYTRQNLLRQSFKFLGERYGWGHSYNARDCSGFVSDVYKTFGILLPRNSGDQGLSAIGSNLRFDRATLAEARVESLQSLEVGDLIYMPGHVMMYLGEVNGEPYVIHDVHGLSYDTADGEYSSGVLSGVSVTPLLPLRAGNDRSYVDSIASIKKIT